MQNINKQLNAACIFNIQKFSIHDGPGIRTAVFFKGCPLHCLWCSNPESQHEGVQPEREISLRGKLYTLQEALDICLADRDFYLESGGGVTLTGGEPLSQANFASMLLSALKKEAIHTAIETTGFASSELFLKVCELSDLLLYDIKHYDSRKHMEGTGVGNELVLKNLSLAVEAKKDILIRIPVIPDFNDSPSDALGFSRTIRQIGLSRVQLLPFHQFGQKKYESLAMEYTMASEKALHPEDLDGYRSIFEENGIDCFY